MAAIPAPSMTLPAAIIGTESVLDRSRVKGVTPSWLSRAAGSNTPRWPPAAASWALRWNTTGLFAMRCGRSSTRKLGGFLAALSAVRCTSFSGAMMYRTACLCPALSTKAKASMPRYSPSAKLSGVAEVAQAAGNVGWLAAN